MSLIKWLTTFLEGLEWSAKQKVSIVRTSTILNKTFKIMKIALV